MAARKGIIAVKHSERNKHVWACNIVTRYGDVVGEAFSTFVGVNSRKLRNGVLRDRQWESCG